MNNKNNLSDFIEGNLPSFVACEDIIKGIEDAFMYVCGNDEDATNALLEKINATLDKQGIANNRGVAGGSFEGASYAYRNGTFTITEDDKKLLLTTGGEKFTLIYGEHNTGFNNEICTKKEGGYTRASLDDEGEIVLETQRLQKDPLPDLYSILGEVSNLDRSKSDAFAILADPDAIENITVDRRC